jgi:hypothetical protein
MDVHRAPTQQWESFEMDLVDGAKSIGADKASVDRIGVYLGGIKGARFVCYFDDFEVKGTVPEPNSYQNAISEEKALQKLLAKKIVAALEAKLSDFKKDISRFDHSNHSGFDYDEIISSQIANIEKQLDKGKDGSGFTYNAQMDLNRFFEHTNDIKSNFEHLSKSTDAYSDVVAYQTDPISPHMILPDDQFIPGILAGSIDLMMAENEFHPVSIVLSPRRDLENVTVQISDLNNSTDTISRSSIDVKIVKCWYQVGGNAGSWRASYINNETKRALTPELLLNDDTLIKVDAGTKQNYVKITKDDKTEYVDISKKDDTRFGEKTEAKDLPIRDADQFERISLYKNRVQQFWLTFHIPAAAKPGVYNGELTFKSNDAVVVSYKVRVRVLPFPLLKPDLISSIYYEGRLSDNGQPYICSSKKSRDQLKAEAVDMLNHGVDSPTLYRSDDEAKYADTMKIYNEVGMNVDNLFYMGLSTSNLEGDERFGAFAEKFAKRNAFFKQFGVKQLFVYGRDEAYGTELMAQKAAWKRLHQIGAKVFAAGRYQYQKDVADVLDVFVGAGRPIKEVVDLFHKSSHKVLSYANPQVGVENPYIYRKNYGLLLKYYDLDGAMDFAYQWSFGNIWNDFDHAHYRDHCFVYPTVNGVVDTIAWEGYREGLDDLRYYHTLQEQVNSAKKSNGDVDLVKRAEEILKDSIARVGESHYDDYIDLREIRNNIIEMILLLRGEGPSEKNRAGGSSGAANP